MSEESFSTANTLLLDAGGLQLSHLQHTLDLLMNHSLDHADLFFESCHSESWLLEDSIVREGGFHINQGIGVRAVHGEKTGFAYSNEILLPALQQAATTARAISRQGADGCQPAWNRCKPPALYNNINPLQSVSAAEKVALLHAIDSACRQRDTRVKQVLAGLSARYQVVLVANSEGTLAADVRPLVRLNINVIVEQHGRREQGSGGGGGRFGYASLLAEERYLQHVEEAVDEALINLEADPAPAGTMPVVLGPGWPGILLHEAIGHGLEGDFNRKQTSVFSNRMGKRIANTQITIVDDGTLMDRRGSLNVDDEGTPSSVTTLVENGILKCYMQDRLNARLMGTHSTGNGRRQSFAHIPMPRMTNTYMLPGQYAPEEIIASVDKGLYASSFGGGQVDITNGQFVFSASQARLIEHGKLTRPVRGATLTGCGAEVLTRVSMVGNDMQLDPGIGTCGKDGQSVPVGVGQPTIRIDELIVGGTLTED